MKTNKFTDVNTVTKNINKMHSMKKGTFCKVPFFIVSRTVSRVKYLMIIYLDLMLPSGSSDLPESMDGPPTFLFGLASDGVYRALPVTSQAVVSYTAFPPLPVKTGGLFLLHFPGSHLHRTLSGILPCEARTFLTCCLSASAAAIICPAHL